MKSLTSRLLPLLFSPFFLRPEEPAPKLDADSPMEVISRPDKPRRGRVAHLRAVRKAVELRLREDGVGNRAHRREVARRFKFAI